MSFRHHNHRRCRPYQHHRFGLFLALSSLTSIDRTTNVATTAMKMAVEAAVEAAVEVAVARRRRERSQASTRSLQMVLCTTTIYKISRHGHLSVGLLLFSVLYLLASCHN